MADEAMPDEPMPDAPLPTPTAKPRRRFAPQLVEQTVKSSKDIQRPAVSEATKSPVRETRDASVQVDDIEMAGTSGSSAHPRRRFAPVPIETTFDSYRVNNKNPHGPTAELTPEPSPTDSLPPVPALPSAPVIETKRTSDHKPKRRFAPQLIETSRRARRAGQEGPATKPTDKTDITPGTNHIYAPKAKKKPVATAPAPARAGSTASTTTETGDQSSPRFLAPRRQQSMKPHPNTRRHTRSATYLPDLDPIPSSESDKSGTDDDGEDEDEDKDEESKIPPISLGAPAREPSDGQTWASRNSDAKNRRESCDEEFSGYLLAVAAREAFRQRELEQAMSAFPNGLQAEGVEHFLVRDNSEDDATYDEEEPLRHGTSQLLRRKETDPSWALKEMRQHAEQLSHLRMGSRIMSFDEDDEDAMETSTPPEDPLWTTTVQRPESRGQLDGVDPKSASRTAATSSPHLAGPTDMAAATPSPRVQPETKGFKSGPFGNPFTVFNNLPFSNGKEDRELRRMRKAASPPMLGADLKFRHCPSPQTTRMEPDHPWPAREEHAHIEEKQRDSSGVMGLWRGYCVAKTNKEMMPSAFQPPNLIATPSEPLSAVDPFAAAFSLSLGHSTESPLGSTSPTKRDPPKGLHLLQGMDDRFKKEKARRERMLAEFDDAFVTQVYNYLSLGYPATARAYDEELSKISGCSIADLRRDDSKKIGKGFMLEMTLRVRGNSSNSDRSGSSDGFRSPEEDERQSRKPPRWRALKLYVREWAKQHPDLEDDGNPMAWGVRARRGSWAI